MVKTNGFIVYAVNLIEQDRSFLVKIWAGALVAVFSSQSRQQTLLIRYKHA